MVMVGSLHPFSIKRKIYTYHNSIKILSSSHQSNLLDIPTWNHYLELVISCCNLNVFIWDITAVAFNFN